MTILENVAFGLRVSGVPKKERQDRAAQAIQLVGLQGWGDRKPRSLSGGMRQRVGLARALVMNTPVLLMDEPFSALDPLIREEMQQELLRLQKTLNKTIVFVTHDPNEAVVLGDRIAIMAKGQVVQEGDPLSIVLSPTNEYVRNFVRGVGIFKVLSASGVIDASVPSFRLGQDVHQHFAKSTGWTHMVALDAENRPIGVVDADTAARLSGVADPSRWRQALSRDFIAVTGSTLVAPLLSEVSLGVRPVLVVHESGNFLGVVTSNSVLQALAAFDSQTSAAVAQPEMTPKTKISHTI
jgi:glycine betaine/proline transport system ATP-binding protein